MLVSELPRGIYTRQCFLSFMKLLDNSQPFKNIHFYLKPATVPGTRGGVGVLPGRTKQRDSSASTTEKEIVITEVITWLTVNYS